MAPSDCTRSFARPSPLMTQLQHSKLVTMIKSDFSQQVPEELGAVHFVGIGGAGMSGIARLFVDAGYPVTGSDVREGATVGALRASGVHITVGHAAANIKGADTLVVTGAIAED